MSWTRCVIAVGCISCTLMSCGDEGTVSPGDDLGASPSSPSRVCEILCGSPCTADLLGVPQDLDQCLDVCAETPVYQACAPKTVGFVRCLQKNGCGERASEECQLQSIDFGQCLTCPDG